jgi:hypothetical protein
MTGVILMVPKELVGSDIIEFMETVKGVEGYRKN